MAAAAILPANGIGPSCVECAVRLTPSDPAVTVELSMVASTCSATWFQPSPAPQAFPCWPTPKAPATAYITELSLASSLTPLALTPASWNLAPPPPDLALLQTRLPTGLVVY